MTRIKQPRTSIPKTKDNFAKFRDQWMRNLIKMDKSMVSSGAKIVGLRIALYMNQEQQWAWPSYDTLGKECGLGVRIVQRHTFALVEAGFIHIDRRRNAGNQYFLDQFWNDPDQTE